MSAATHIAHWPGNDTAVCDEHLGKLASLASILGFQLSSTPCEERVCMNCENERRENAIT